MRTRSVGGEGEGGETPQTNTLIAAGQTTGGGDGHEFFIEINLTDGSINGYSVWGAPSISSPAA